MFDLRGVEGNMAKKAKKSKKTAKEVWDAVGEIFEGRSLMVAIDL